MSKKNQPNKVEKFVKHALACCGDNFGIKIYTSPKTFGVVSNPKGNIIEDELFITLEKEAIEFIVNKKKLHITISKNNIKKILTDIVFDVYNGKYKIDNATKEIYNQIKNQIKDWIYVLPNYHISLKGFETLTIGDVTISKNNIKKLVGNQKNEEFVKLVNDNFKEQYEYIDSIFKVKVRCSDEMKMEQCLWKINIALSLYWICRQEYFEGFLSHAYRDNTLYRFEKMPELHNIDSKNMLTNYPSWKLEYNQYVVSKKTKEFLNEKENKEKIQRIFDPNSKEMYTNMRQFLGWWGEARKHTYSTQFLLIWTAIESLMGIPKGASVISTIATDICNLIYKPEYRYQKYKELKNLYDLRSRCIHSGLIEITKEDVEKIGEIAHTLGHFVIHYYLDYTVEEFRQYLKKKQFASIENEL